jgi:serine/threonine-protein kinase HipA
MLFNFIIGNRDAHGKNFSIIHHETSRLAPYYDLVSTQVYPLTNKFAMAIGNTFRHDRIKREAFKEFARHMNLRPEKVFDLIERMRASVNGAYIPLLAAHEKKYGQAKIYADLAKVIKENLERLGSLADGA